MNKKEMFIKLIEDLLSANELTEGTSEHVDLSEHQEALAYYEAFKNTTETKEKPQFTDNGKLILTTMQKHSEERSNMFSAKQIAEYAFISSRSVSGAVRKLVTDGFVEKMGQDPIIYSLTSSGKEVVFSE